MMTSASAPIMIAVIVIFSFAPNKVFAWCIFCTEQNQNQNLTAERVGYECMRLAYVNAEIEEAKGNHS